MEEVGLLSKDLSRYLVKRITLSCIGFHVKVINSVFSSYLLLSV